MATVRTPASRTRVPVPVGSDSQPSEQPASPPEAATAGAQALDPNRVGVVFVHGIGQQPACDTFLTWSAPIVDVLTTWRAEHGYVPMDPVRRCDYDLSGARLPILELDVPAHDGHPAQSWVLTEAWWAAVTRPPSLSSMTAYVSRALPRIMTGIREGYGIRVAAAEDRRARARAVVQDSDLPHAALVLQEMSPGRGWAWVDWLDSAQKNLTILALVPALALGTVALAFYAPFRKIPLGPIQELAILHSTDNFLTRWFGELPDIIDDAVQAANVRSRLVNAIRGLRAEGCGRIVVVSHSGGAIVSFTTLLDPAYLQDDVDKLVTLGEGLSIAWRLQTSDQGLPLGSRLAGDLEAARPNLRWVDFWSSYDPAPAGPLRPPAGVHIREETNPAVNRMSIIEDHGTYWDNDEGFLIPLMRHLDTADGPSSGSRFFRDAALDAVRSERRRQRVAVLAAWRWIATFAALVPLTVATLTGILGVAGRPGPERFGRDAAGWLTTLPGISALSGPVNSAARSLGWPQAVGAFLAWAFGAALVAIVFLLLVRIGVGRWEAWDLDERRVARRRVLGPLHRRGAAVTFLLLTAAAIAMSAGTLALLWR